MSHETSPSRKNYNAYIKGKEPLKNAVLLQPDDKINDYIRKNTKRRFWVKEYESFKSSMMEDAGAMGLAPGQGNPIAPTPNSLGSGDKFPSLAKGGNKKKDKKKDVNESYGENVESFAYHLDQSNIDTYNEPDEFGEINGLKANIRYEAEIEYNQHGISNIIFKVTSINLTWETKISSPEDIYDENAMIEDKEFNVDKPQADVNRHSLPFYPTNLAIHFNRSADPSHWKFEIDFGRDGF